ncbi:hypothetical protein C8R44DRAFT_873820 [Mycena epipterygia]|nr:hypothetical protein C8R44DRAFT_873820 [Mycena epipterygia]
MGHPRSERSVFFSPLPHLCRLPPLCRRRLYSHYSSSTTATRTIRTNNATHNANTTNTADRAHRQQLLQRPQPARKYTGGGGVNNDSQILMARKKIATAAEAEKEADRALLHARARLRDAMEHIKVLEIEAKEEALRAKAKQNRLADAPSLTISTKLSLIPIPIPSTPRIS